MQYNETVITALQARREDLEVQIEEHRNIIATLDAEKEAINRELLTSNEIYVHRIEGPTTEPTKKKRVMSAAARKRISRAMKARWKDRRKSKKIA